MATSKNTTGPGKPASGVSAGKIHEVLSRIDPHQLALAVGTAGGNINPAEARALLRTAGVPEDDINANLETYRTSIDDYARQTVPPEETRRVQAYARMLEESEHELASLIGEGKIMDAATIAKDISGQSPLESQITPGMEHKEEEGKSEA